MTIALSLTLLLLQTHLLDVVFILEHIAHIDRVDEHRQRQGNEHPEET